MKTISLKCKHCNKPVEIKKKEFDRQVKKGRNYFYCSRSCSTANRNYKRAIHKKIRNKICPVCDKPFTTVSFPRENTFCSRSCASKGSMSDYRRSKMRESGLMHKDNLSVRSTLETREAWKYVKLKEKLDNANVRHKFEHEINSFIFDLAIFDKNLLIEFDGRYHTIPYQKKADDIRDKEAEELGWKVIRLKSKENTEIDPNILNGICI